MEIYTLFTLVDVKIVGLLMVLGIAAFVISTLSGGGGALILVPVLNWTLGVTNTAPALNLGSFLGRPSRLIIFWKYINWNVCLHYAPAGIVGAWLGSWFFSSVRIDWLQVVVGLFLVSTIFQYRFGSKAQSFPMQLWYFTPLAVVVALMGTIVGALGPVLNPFYLNMGLDKEELIATKTANSFFIGISQISSYTFFRLLYNEYWIYGISLGLGATIGNILGKKFLSGIKSTTFRKLLILLMVISGTFLIYGQLAK